MLGKVEFEGTPRPARPVEHREGAVERGQALGRERQRVSGRVILRRLHGVIGQPRRRAHDRALEMVAPLASAGVDPQMRGDTGAVLARL